MWLIKTLVVINICFFFCNCQEYRNTSQILTNSTANRIIGGYPINIIDASFMVSVHEGNFFKCGGSIISKHWTLTACHCINEKRKYKLIGGSHFFNHGGITRKVILAVKNLSYNRQNMNNDIAMLKHKAFNWSANIRPILLPGPNCKVPNQLHVSGWGTINKKMKNPSKTLRRVSVSKISTRICNNEYKGITKIEGKFHICASAQGKDACEGDSGGPLISNGVQFGIVSFGKGCAEPNYSGVYTNLVKQMSWIKKIRRRFGGDIPKQRICKS